MLLILLYSSCTEWVCCMCNGNMYLGGRCCSVLGCTCLYTNNNNRSGHLFIKLKCRSAAHLRSVHRSSACFYSAIKNNKWKKPTAWFCFSCRRFIQNSQMLSIYIFNISPEKRNQTWFIHRAVNFWKNDSISSSVHRYSTSVVILRNICERLGKPEE